MIRVRLLWDREVAVFACHLGDQDPLDHLLSPDELERADRFRAPELRRRFVSARGVLRSLLAEWDDVDPRDLRIMANDHGKPRLVSHSRTAFNVSHSGDFALYALAAGCDDVGVDVEQIRHVDALDLSERYFSADERRELIRCSPDTRLSAFFDGWVRKEAVIKADGRGMAIPLDSFSVRLSDPPLLLTPPPEPSDVSWELRSLDVGHSARAAMAVRRPHDRRFQSDQITAEAAAG